MSDKSVQGYVQCTYTGCSEAATVKKYARTSKNEHYADCPVHGRIDGRYSASKVNNDYILQNMTANAADVQAVAQPEAVPAQPEPYPLNENPPEPAPQATDPDDGTEDEDKPGALKKYGPFVLIALGLAALFRGGN